MSPRLWRSSCRGQAGGGSCASPWYPVRSISRQRRREQSRSACIRSGSSPSFATADGAIDPDMVAVASMIIKRRSGHFDPITFRDRYQEALRELIEAKMKGLHVRPRQISPPRPVVDLMAALKL